ncbi:MAG TPA: hypothetical protein VMU19_04110 [Bryobacteraceae bacterium]|nr:hypothetical protein [Bryobacteraceae bacterium]
MSLVAMTGVMGLVVDAGWAYWRKLECKTAAQAAAMAAVKAASTPYSAQVSTGCSGIATGPLYVGCQYATANGMTDGGNSGKQSVKMAAGTSAVPVAGVANVAYWASATVSETTPLWFGAVLGKTAFAPAVTSTAVIISSSGGGCVYTLGQTGTDIAITGSAILSSGCGVYVDSNSGSAVSIVGTGQINTSGGSKTTIVGNYSIVGTGSISAPVTGAARVDDPFASDMPATPPQGSCEPTAQFVGSSTWTIPAGTYCNSVSVTGTGHLILTSGTYVLKAGFSITGGATITATGPVTLYVLGGSISWTGNPIVTLTAPNSGTYNGILIWQAAADAAAGTMTGGATLQLNGVVYMPGAGLSYCGGGATTSTTIVSKTLTLTGNSVINSPAASPYFVGSGGPSGAYLVQ